VRAVGIATTSYREPERCTIAAVRTITMAVGLAFAFTTSVRADDTAASEVAAPSAADAGNAERRAEIERSLAELRDEEGSAPRLWPIVTITLGVTAVLLAATSGAASAISCDDSCSAGAWQGPTVVGGAAVTTLGILWLRWTDADLREIDTARSRLETERERLGPAPSNRAHEHATPRVALTLRGSF
jgi:hypothetical protein